MTEQTTDPATERQLAITSVCVQNFGDHADAVRQPHRYVPGETVEDLVARVFPGLSSKWGMHDPINRLEIQVVPPVAAIPPGGPDPWKLEVPAADEAPF